MEQSLACSPVKWGSGGAGAWNESASLALEVLPHLHSRRIFGSFLCAQTGTRCQAKPGPGKPGWFFLPLLLALSKEMGSGKVRFQRRSLWTPRSARLDLKWLRGPDPCFGRQKKWFLENSAQGRQPLDSGSRASAPNLPVGSLTPKHQHRAQPRQYKIPNVECSEHNRVRQQYRRRGQHRQ